VRSRRHKWCRGLNTSKVLVGNLKERERQHRLGNNNKMDLKEIECEGVERSDWAENRDRLL